MRAILAAAAIAGALPVLSGNAEAQYAPWCSGYARGGTNCGWYTYQQCMDNIFGVGGWCYRNPFAIAGARDRPGFYAPGFYDPEPAVVQRKRKLRRTS